MHGFLDLKKTRVHSNNKNLFDVKKTKEYIQIIKTYLLCMARLTLLYFQSELLLTLASWALNNEQ